MGQARPEVLVERGQAREPLVQVAADEQAVSGSFSVASSKKSSADRRTMSLARTSNSAAVFAGLATASRRRAITRTSGAEANCDPPATTHSNPSARSASAYTSARPILPKSTTISPGE